MVAESLVVFFVVVRLIILRPTFNRKLAGAALQLLSAGGCFRAHFYTFHVHGKLCLYDKRPQNMDIGSICAVEQEIASDISAMIITRTNSFVILILGY